MTIGIIGAMEEEISRLKAKMEVINAKHIAGMQFNFGKMHGKNAVLVRSGIGKVNAAVCTQILIDHYGVDCVINTGVAGSMNADVHLGDVVVSTDLVHHDFDTSAFEGEPVGFIPRLGVRFFEADSVLIDTAISCAEDILKETKVFKGRIASGDQFISNPDIKAGINKNFKPFCVEMEGAAIAQACYLNEIPFVVIRAISDNSDGNIEIYENSLDAAIKNSSHIVEKIVEAYNG